MFPAVSMPVVRDGDSIINPPRDEEHWKDWAQYDIAKSERDYHRALTLGTKQAAEMSKPPMLHQLDQAGKVFAYRDKATKKIFTFNLDRDVPKEMVAAAVEGGWPISRMIQTGFLPSAGWTEGKTVTVNGRVSIVRSGLDIVSGRYGVNVEDVGRAGEVNPRAREMSAAARKVLDFVNTGTSTGDAKQFGGWIDRIKKIRKMEVKKAELEAGKGTERGNEMLKFQRDFRAQFQWTPIIVDEKMTKDLLGWGGTEYHAQGGWLSAFPADQERSLRTEAGQEINLLYDSSTGTWYDLEGVRLVGLEGYAPGDTIPSNLLVEKGK